MPKHFEVTTPRPLGQRHTVNSRDDAEMEAAFALLAEKLAPAVAELLSKGETSRETTTNGSNGRKIRADDITSRYQLPDDEFDTLPDGDSPGGASAPADGYELPD